MLAADWRKTWEKDQLEKGQDWIDLNGNPKREYRTRLFHGQVHVEVQGNNGCWMLVKVIR